VVSQRLLKRADERGRVAAVEILLGTPAVSALIREKKIHQIPSVIQTGRRDGMQMMDDALQQLVTSGAVTHEEAQRLASTRLTAPGERRAAPEGPARSGAAPQPGPEPSGAGRPDAARPSGLMPAPTRPAR
jgi:hypothetical protein